MSCCFVRQFRRFLFSICVLSELNFFEFCGSMGLHRYFLHVVNMLFTMEEYLHSIRTGSLVLKVLFCRYFPGSSIYLFFII